MGLALLNRIAAEGFGRLSDRAITAVWLGLILLAVTLQAVSLFYPLSPLVGLTVALVLGALAVALPSTRITLTALLQRISGITLIGGLGLVVGMALLTVKPVRWVESTFYHYTAIRWLSEFGTVSGLALIRKNLGITSTWFALNAPLNGGAIAFRAGSLLNGFILCVALLHFLICLSRWRSGQARLSDRFKVGFFLLFLGYLAVAKEMQLILVSPSPDLPIALLVEVVSWSILVVAESTPQKSHIQSAIIPLILAVGAVTIKLSALPLWVVASLFYGFQSRWSLRHLLIGGTAIAILLLSTVLTGYTISGCPLYPSDLFCLNVPWSLSVGETQQFANETQSLTEWYGSPPAEQNTHLWLFWQWLKGRTLNQVMAFLVIVSGVCSLYLGWTFNNKRHTGKIWLLALGILGILFIISKGPLIRFGIGYLLVLPALTIAVWSEISLPKKFTEIELIFKNSKHPLERVKLPVILIFACSLGLAVIINPSSLQAYWLLPPNLRASVTTQQQVNGIDYFISSQGGCSASPLPCVKKVPSNVELKEPILGLKGGFVRTAH